MPTADEQSISNNLDFETSMPGSEINSLQSSDFLAYETGEIGKDTSILGAVESVHPEQEVCTVKVMAPTGPEPSQQKPWTLSQRDGATTREQIRFHKLTVRCELENNRLTQDPIDVLRSRGATI